MEADHVSAGLQQPGGFVLEMAGDAPSGHSPATNLGRQMSVYCSQQIGVRTMLLFMGLVQFP
jgi:hypothetical protein